MDGCGNDFVVVYARDLPTDFGAQEAEALCDRQVGVGAREGHPDIGADGVLVVGGGPETAAGEMRVWNADGSRAEMCGNGLRCVVRRLDEDGAWPADGEGAIQVGAQLHRCWRVGAEIATELGRVRFGASLRIETPEGTACGQVVDVGNPHFVVLAASQENTLPDLLDWAPSVEVAPAFPHRTNVEWVEGAGPHLVRVRVWERGVGETQACGSGALAAAVVAAKAGLVTGPKIDVDLPGGSLRVSLPPTDGDCVTLTGPASSRWSSTWKWLG